MTITQTVYDRYVSGNKRVFLATFTKSFSGTQEVFVTGLRRVFHFNLMQQDTGTVPPAGTNWRVASGTAFPTRDGNITVYFDATSGTLQGVWRAEGY